MANSKPGNGPDIEVVPPEANDETKRPWRWKLRIKPKVNEAPEMLPYERGKGFRSRGTVFVVSALALFAMGFAGALLWLSSGKTIFSVGGRSGEWPAHASPGMAAAATPSEVKSPQGGASQTMETKAVPPTNLAPPVANAAPTAALAGPTSQPSKGAQPQPTETLEKFISAREATGTQKQTTELARLEAERAKHDLESTKARLLKEQFEKNPGLVLENAGGQPGAGAFRIPPGAGMPGSREGQPGPGEKPGLLQPEGPGPLVRVTQETPEGREALVLVNDRLSVVREGEPVGSYTVKTITTNGVTFMDKAGRTIYRPLAAVRGPEEGRLAPGGQMNAGPPTIPAPVGPPQTAGPYEDQPQAMQSPVPHGATSQNPQGRSREER
jgi:hypothetical protein